MFYYYVHAKALTVEQTNSWLVKPTNTIKINYRQSLKKKTCFLGWNSMKSYF